MKNINKYKIIDIKKISKQHTVDFSLHPHEIYYANGIISHNCHATYMQDGTYGRSISISDLLKEIEPEMELVDGITLSGGDPCYHGDAMDEFVRAFKATWPDKSVLLFTGFTLEHIPISLEYVDYIIDGRYEKDLPTTKQWRGSDNQKFYIKEQGEWKEENESSIWKKRMRSM